MRAVDIGVGHDDDAVVAQIVGVAILAHSAAEREAQIGDFADWRGSCRWWRWRRSGFCRG